MAETVGGDAAGVVATAIIVGAVLLMIVMRGLLRRATTLQAELAEVV